MTIRVTGTIIAASDIRAFQDGPRYPWQATVRIADNRELSCVAPADIFGEYLLSDAAYDGRYPIVRAEAEDNGDGWFIITSLQAWKPDDGTPHASLDGS